MNTVIPAKAGIQAVAWPTLDAIELGEHVSVWLPASAGMTSTGGILTNQNTINGFYEQTTAHRSFPA